LTFASLFFLQVKDLSIDLQDGLLLVQLLDKLASPKTVGRYSKNPVNIVQMIENLGKALHFIHSQNIKLVNIGKRMKGAVRVLFAWDQGH
jgi:hypothetical protein